MTEAHGTTRRRPPRSILFFATAYVAFAITAFINNLLLIDQFVDQAADQGLAIPRAVAAANFGLRLLFRLGLIWLIVWRASNVARWFVVGLSLPWVYQVPNAYDALSSRNWTWLPWLASFLFLSAAVACLFLREPRIWFARKGRSIADDRIVFD